MARLTMPDAQSDFEAALPAARRDRFRLSRTRRCLFLSLLRPSKDPFSPDFLNEGRRDLPCHLPPPGDRGAEGVLLLNPRR